MGNQSSVGWVSAAALDREDVINTWIATHIEIYKAFTNEQLRLGLQVREEHFAKDIKHYLHDGLHKRFLVYKTEKVFAFVIVQNKVDPPTQNTNGDTIPGMPFVQIYGIAVRPYTLYNLRTVSLALFRQLQLDYPDTEFRGMVKVINERGKMLYKYLGAVQCENWHDEEFDEHHVPLRITSVAANLAADKNASSTLPKELTGISETISEK